jgi:alpha-mannosidase
MSRRRVHYVLSTHWDREWYQSFQDFRFRLVRTLDTILAGLEDGRLRGPFQTDGQAILLEDYLEIRPDRRDQVQRLLREGKLISGPWYVLPDEFTISGESLIRNLRYGREIVRSFGSVPSNAGFLCDMFGHISQMPQILAGFGIPGAFIWRGTNLPDRRVVKWRGADGTELPSVRFGAVGYCDYAFKIRRAIDPKWHLLDEESLAEDLDHFVKVEAEATDTDALLFFDGGDHQEWDQGIYDVMTKWMSWEGQQYDVKHTSLDQFLEEMVSQREKITTTITGELREPGQFPLDQDQQWVIPGVYSSRVWIKQANNHCQTLLCQWAEPFSALRQYLLREEIPQGYLTLAWRWLLQNHPHDSMDGCSIDQVHRDMCYRFDQSRMIADRLTLESTLRISANISKDINKDELRVTVFNPQPRRFEGITEIDLRLPPDWPTFNEFFGFEPIIAFRIFDVNGTEIPYQRLAQSGPHMHTRHYPSKFSQAYQSKNVLVSLQLSIPAMGYTTLTVRPGKQGIPTRYPSVPGLATSECSMENETLKVEIESNGAINLTDKRTGQSYSRLLIFEDIADIGDGWYHGQAINDQTFFSTASPADIILVHDGPNQTTFRIRHSFTIPEEYDFTKMVRSERRVIETIETQVTLRRGQEVVEFQTNINNLAGDHRLRVLFPSGVLTNTYLADSAFDVIERPIALRQDNHLFRELEVETKPQQSWTAVSDEQRGLAVIAEGLLETAVRDVPERPIALTLFRSTRRTVMTDTEPDGQLIGMLNFRYWLTPLKGEPDRTHLLELGQRISAGLRNIQLLTEDQPFYRNEGTLPAEAGMFELEGPAVLTSARQVNDGFEIRLFNPLGEVIEASIAFPQYSHPIPWTKYQMVDFESKPLSASFPFKSKITININSKKIITVKLS